MELLSMTVRREAATVYSVETVANALAAAKRDFPDYTLAVETVDGGAIVRSDGMRVQRWLRA